MKTNFFLSEIDINKKTIEVESTKNNKRIQTSINSTSKKNNRLKLKNRLLKNLIKRQRIIKKKY